MKTAEISSILFDEFSEKYPQKRINNLKHNHVVMICNNIDNLVQMDDDGFYGDHLSLDIEVDEQNLSVIIKVYFHMLELQRVNLKSLLCVELSDALLIERTEAVDTVCMSFVVKDVWGEINE